MINWLRNILCKHERYYRRNHYFNSILGIEKSRIVGEECIKCGKYKKIVDDDSILELLKKHDSTN